MSSPLVPGVYIEELPLLPAIKGVPTSVAGFIGVSERGPVPVLLTSLAEFRQAHPNPSQFLSLAVEGFFANGGSQCYVATISADDSFQNALDALAPVKLQLLCCPDEGLVPNAASLMAVHCEQMKDRFCILQSPQPVIPEVTHQGPVQSAFAAYYYPWISVLSNGVSVTIPPAGHVAGVYARTDAQHGVHIAPAGSKATLTGVTGLSVNINTAEGELLNSRGINVIRNFPGQGNMVWGARTTSQDQEWLYVPIRRVMIFIEQSLQSGLQGALFEPNGPTLWMSVRAAIESFLLQQWKAKALVGTTAKEALSVRCDQTTMTQADIDNGSAIALVGVAMLHPAEFMFLRVTLQLQPQP
jgi:phage tail sheath protein FI